jgi:hypothetical protein
MRKAKGNIQLGRLKCKWIVNITIYLREIGWGVMGWIECGSGWAQCRALVNTAMNRQVP